MKFAKVIFLTVVATIITGCAHPIVISPNLSKLERDKSAQPIQRNVGYYFVGNRAKEVTTPGGGGDSVRYKPYYDIEAGFRTILGNVSKNVSALNSDKDVEISKNNINYIIALDVTTNSSSTGSFTWPPTIFSVTLNCNIKDESGKDITNLTVIGDGRAEYDEFKSDFSLAGKRASQDALIKMQRALLSSSVFTGGFSKVAAPINPAIQQSASQPSPSVTKPATQPVAQLTASQPIAAQTKENKLKELKRLYDAGLIGKEIYLEQQKAIFANP
jgi:hypothetical protein